MLSKSYQSPVSRRILQFRFKLRGTLQVNYERRMGKNWLQDLAKIKTTFVKEYISEADCIILVFKSPFHYKNGVKHNNWYYEV